MDRVNDLLDVDVFTGELAVNAESTRFAIFQYQKSPMCVIRSRLCIDIWDGYKFLEGPLGFLIN